LQGNRDVLAAGLAKLGFKILPSEGTYFLTVDISGITTNPTAFCERVVKDAGVALIPLSVFPDGKPAIWCALHSQEACGNRRSAGALEKHFSERCNDQHRSPHPHPRSGAQFTQRTAKTDIRAGLDPLRCWRRFRANAIANTGATGDTQGADTVAVVRFTGTRRAIRAPAAPHVPQSARLTRQASRRQHRGAASTPRPVETRRNGW